MEPNYHPFNIENIIDENIDMDDDEADEEARVSLELNMGSEQLQVNAGKPASDTSGPQALQQTHGGAVASSYFDTVLGQRNVGGRTFDPYMPPVPPALPRGDLAKKRPFDAHGSPARSSQVPHPQAPAASTSHTERQQRRGNMLRIMPTPAHPLVTATSPHQVVGNFPDVAKEDTMPEGSGKGEVERIRKVKLVERDSPQIMEQLESQAARIEHLTRQLEEQQARMAETAQHMQAEAEERLREAERRMQTEAEGQLQEAKRRMQAEAEERLREAERRVQEAERQAQEALSQVHQSQNPLPAPMISEHRANSQPPPNSSIPPSWQASSFTTNPEGSHTAESHPRPQGLPYRNSPLVQDPAFQGDQGTTGNHFQASNPQQIAAHGASSTAFNPMPGHFEETRVPGTPSSAMEDGEDFEDDEDLVVMDMGGYENMGNSASRSSREKWKAHRDTPAAHEEESTSAEDRNRHRARASNYASSEEDVGTQRKSTNAEDRNRYKARVSDYASSEEDETYDDVGGGRSVPPPMKFSRPKGGAGPTLRLVRSSNENVRSTQSPRGGEEIPQPRLMTVEEKMDVLMESLRGMEKKLERWGGDSTELPNRSRRTRPGPFKAQPKRICSSARTEVLGKVRRELNTLLGIKTDKDILKGGFSPPQEALDLWEADEQGVGPTLKGMKPDWNDLRSSWNCRLEELFCIYFCKKMEIDDEDMEDDVCYMFRERLSRLRRIMKANSARAGETFDQTTIRVQRTSAAALARQRPNSRRRELYFSRLDITLANRETPDGDIDPAWDALHNIVVSLGQAGMSSDESDHNEPGRTKYIVKKRDWRNRDLIRYLALIDRDRNTTNAYGNTRAGNPPRYRSRRHGNRSVRLAIPELPVNFYDSGWLDSLRNGERKSLRPKQAVGLPDIEED